jgi:DNA-binding NarL/FixJ family response regulator
MNKKILIADDHIVVRVGTKMILENQIPNISVDYAANYTDVKKMLTAENYDLLILDIEMEGSIYKYMIKEIKAIQEVKIMIFSSSKEDIAFEYVQEGAEGYLNKLSNDETLVTAVKSIFEEGCYYPSKMIQHISKRHQKSNLESLLSEREFQVFTLLAKGNDSVDIADMLDIHKTTVSTFKRRIYTKLGITKFIELLDIYNKQSLH